MNSLTKSTNSDRGASPVTLESITSAAMRLDGEAVKTPLLESGVLNRITEGRVLIKPEVLQRTGSFKFRGAYNFISRIDEKDRERGVIAYSSGNHAQAVAAAASIFGIPATIVMPEDAPKMKIAKTRSYNANVLLYDRYKESREDIVADIQQRSGATLVRPFDDPKIIAGQGTCGLELIIEALKRDSRPDQVLIPCGGGGLIAGSGTAIKAIAPDVEIFAVEPEDFDDTLRSLKSGKREKVDGDKRSVCDALLAPSPGELTFAINCNLLHGALGVSDDEVLEAIRFAFSELKLVVEPGGAVALAAILSGKIRTHDRITAIVLSGGNVDADFLSKVLTKK
ncbi:MAG: threonine/serine dehydratase [Kiloniellales bacterium]|nr:threonine/serine dehydratase [Kiloniellales bacterium]